MGTAPQSTAKIKARKLHERSPRAALDTPNYYALIGSLSTSNIESIFQRTSAFSPGRFFLGDRGFVITLDTELAARSQSAFNMLRLIIPHSFDDIVVRIHEGRNNHFTLRRVGIAAKATAGAATEQTTNRSEIPVLGAAFGRRQLYTRTIVDQRQQRAGLLGIQATAERCAKAAAQHAANGAPDTTSIIIREGNDGESE